MGPASLGSCLLPLHATDCPLLCVLPEFQTALCWVLLSGCSQVLQTWQDPNAAIFFLLIKDSPFPECLKPEAWVSPLVSSLLFMNSLFPSLVEFAFLQPFSRYVPNMSSPLFCLISELHYSHISLSSFTTVYI